MGKWGSCTGEVGQWHGVVLGKWDFDMEIEGYHNKESMVVEQGK